MNCREKILSEDYMSILLDYVPEEANQEDEAFCYQQVDGTLGIYYLDRSAVLPLSASSCLASSSLSLTCRSALSSAAAPLASPPSAFPHAARLSRTSIQTAKIIHLFRFIETASHIHKIILIVFSAAYRRRYR